LLGEGFRLGERAQLLPGGLLDIQPIEQRGKLSAILGAVNHAAGCAQDGKAGLASGRDRLFGGLAAHGNDQAERLFQAANFADGLKAQLLEVEPIAMIVIRAHCLRIVIDHKGLITQLAQGQGGIDTAPIKFDRAARSDTHRSRG